MKKTKQPSRPLSFEDYQRLSAVMKAVLDGANADTDAACPFFAIAGATLLREVHGLEAEPLAGVATYLVNDKAGYGLAFGEVAELSRSMRADLDTGKFHCWVRCGEYAIDFMAPFFQESAARIGHAERIDRRMFQKPYATMAPDGFSHQREGDFWLDVNKGLTRHILESFAQNEETMDLIEVCQNWYRPSPRKMLPAIGLGSNDGIRKVLTLPKLGLTGVW